ncbi:MAG: hypothetical protein BGP15_26330 [Sphingobacterium sp. 40-24]|nr:MAG: hypothetical protein BGP15_26330 [Sphingobacterium sp. 40-24]HAK30911.1 hypothetical protein [Sphingobacterium sp.]
MSQTGVHAGHVQGRHSSRLLDAKALSWPNQYTFPAPVVKAIADAGFSNPRQMVARLKNAS